QPLQMPDRQTACSLKRNGWRAARLRRGVERVGGPWGMSPRTDGYSRARLGPSKRGRTAGHIHYASVTRRGEYGVDQMIVVTYNCPGEHESEAGMARSALQEELRKKHPFASAEQEASLNLARTHDHFEQEFARLFQKHGISAPQYNVLRILRGVGGEGLPCLEVGAQMVTRMPDITRLVDRLEQAGLAERGRTAPDRPT